MTQFMHPDSKRAGKMTQKLEPVMNVSELTALLADTFPQAFSPPSPFTVTEVFPSGAVLRLAPDESHLRHGGTVSGPTMFALADIAGYVAILAHVGPATATVSTNVNINFLRKPQLKPLQERATILKLGRQLVVTDILISSVDDGEILAHATATYSMPPKKGLAT
jgi:uncharacterized protein (TIGR00369 family)